jgi:protein-disulfide isomerase
LAQLDTDIARHADDIAGLIKRNLDIAQAIGLQGTPGFLIGLYKVNAALDDEGFIRAVADARARQKAK